MLYLRGFDTVCISKVKGHADEGMVLHGRVREADRIGNDAADEAADFGRRRVSPAVIDARRTLSGVCGRWYLVILDPASFFSWPFLVPWLIMMVGMVLLLILLSGPLVLSPRGAGWFMRFGTRLFCLDHLVFGIRNGLVFLLLPSVLRTLLFGPILLVSWSSGSLFFFEQSSHWPVGDLDLGAGGVSFVELLILFELLAGERLSLEKAHPRYLRPGRLISVSSVPFGPGIDVWRSCRFIGALMRSLSLLPGGLRHFVPCSIGANHCRLRHIGWENCGHCLGYARPRLRLARHTWTQTQTHRTHTTHNDSNNNKHNNNKQKQQ